MSNDGSCHAERIAELEAALFGAVRVIEIASAYIVLRHGYAAIKSVKEMYHDGAEIRLALDKARAALNAGAGKEG